MNSIFRYGKSIAASLTVAVAALAANYGQHWMFPEVDPLSNDHSVAVDTVTANSESTSPMRDRVEGERLTWKVAVVTNRDHTSEGNTSAVSESSDTRTLAEQTIDAMFATAETTYGFVDVQLPIVRPRGSCVLKEQSEHRVSMANTNGNQLSRGIGGCSKRIESERRFRVRARFQCIAEPGRCSSCPGF